MLQDFYMTRHMPYTYYDDVQEVIKNWAIKVIALDHVALDTMTEQDHASMVTRQDAAFLFRVEQCLDLGAANEAVDAMLLEADEYAYEEKAIHETNAIDRAEEFAEQFAE